MNVCLFVAAAPKTPHFIWWLLILIPFLAAFVLIHRSRLGPVPSSLLTIVTGVLLAAACWYVDFWASFGEAFTNGIDRSRAPIYFVLTALITIGFVVTSIGKAK